MNSVSSSGHMTLPLCVDDVSPPVFERMSLIIRHLYREPVLVTFGSESPALLMLISKTSEKTGVPALADLSCQMEIITVSFTEVFWEMVTT